MPGAIPNKLVRSKLSLLLSGVEHCVVDAAEALWDAFEAHACAGVRDAARRQLDYLGATSAPHSAPLDAAGAGATGGGVATPAQGEPFHGPRPPAAAAAASAGGARAATRLGRTGWNAFSFNLVRPSFRAPSKNRENFTPSLAPIHSDDRFWQDYPTAAHHDAKNVGGSFSALLVLETDAPQPYAGCFYLLPQYRAALDARQGVALFHRSGDAGIGMHANSGLFRPSGAAHRAVLVFYLTKVSDAA